MAKPLLDDALWTIIEPHIPVKQRRFKHPGRKRVPDRACLTGILFVLLTGIQWEMLPKEMGCGCGMTCWRRLAEWQREGVWQKVHEILLARLNAAEQLDWSRAVVDSSSVRAGRGGDATGPNPVDRGKPGSKHHILTDADGTPLVATVTAANVSDGTMLLPLVDAIPPVKGKVGAPRFRPDSVAADKAYHSNFREVMLHVKGIEPLLPRRGSDDDTSLGRLRWVVERTIAWLHQFRRLRVRYERRADIHQAFLSLGCILICFRTLDPVFC
ncbi:MAG: IS5 family transposase [Phycisphaerales bacterium]